MAAPNPLLPNALTTLRAGLTPGAQWTDNHTHAWNDMITMLRRTGQLTGDSPNLQQIQQAYLRSMYQGSGVNIDAALNDAAALSRIFNDRFNRFVADRGAIHPGGEGIPPTLVAPHRRTDGSLDRQITAPTGFAGGQDAWNQLVVRLRAAGYLQGDNDTQDHVRWAFLASQRAEGADGPSLEGLEAAFTAAYQAGQGHIQRRLDGTANTMGPAQGILPVTQPRRRVTPGQRGPGQRGPGQRGPGQRGPGQRGPGQGRGEEDDENDGGPMAGRPERALQRFAQRHLDRDLPRDADERADLADRLRTRLERTGINLAELDSMTPDARRDALRDAGLNGGQIGRAETLLRESRDRQPSGVPHSPYRGMPGWAQRAFEP